MIRICLAALSAALLGVNIFAVPSFPGAVGWGASSVGGRGGQVIHVTNLNRSGTGSLAAAVAVAGPKIIVFDTAGVINQGAPIYLNSNTTIAGQTAPGGITLQWSGLYARSGANNIIVRFVRVRRGPDAADGDAFRTVNGSSIIIDHCSGMWVSDEVVDVANCSLVTLQNCMVGSPGMCYEQYGTGSGWGNNRTLMLGAPCNGRVTVYRNLFFHAMKRVPYLTNRGTGDPTGKNFEVINNVMYNNMRNDDESFDDNSTMPVNLVGNCYKVGPNASYAGVPWFHQGQVPATMSMYVRYNHHYTIPSAYDTARAFVNSTTVRSFTSAYIGPKMTPDSMVLTGKQIFESLLPTAGPQPRDATERRIADEIRNGTGSWESACYPTYDPFNTYDPLRRVVDTDKDGMPDSWETAHGLNPNNIADRTTDMGGYNAVEVYLNELADTLVTRANVSAESHPRSSAQGGPSITANPNPFRGTVEVGLFGIDPRSTRVRVYDVTGKIVADFGSPASAVITWDAGRLPGGLYLVKAVSGNTVLTRQLMLQK